MVRRSYWLIVRISLWLCDISCKPRASPPRTAANMNSRTCILAAGGVILPAIAVAALWAGKRKIASWAAIASTSLTLVPTLCRNHSAFGPIFTRFQTSRREVWLTIDDGPYSSELVEMLEVLAQFEAFATFFLVGNQVVQRPQCVSQILAAGHTIGNHTQHHPVSRFWSLPSSELRREVSDCSQTLIFAGAARPQWFRSPVGMSNPFLHPILAGEHLKLIGWHAGGMDGFISSEAYWSRRILPRLCPGAILLLHQLQQGGGAQTLRILLRNLKRLGYSCVLPRETSLI